MLVSPVYVILLCLATSYFLPPRYTICATQCAAAVASVAKLFNPLTVEQHFNATQNLTSLSFLFSCYIYSLGCKAINRRAALGELLGELLSPADRFASYTEYRK